MQTSESRGLRSPTFYKEFLHKIDERIGTVKAKLKAAQKAKKGRPSKPVQKAEKSTKEQIVRLAMQLRQAKEKGNSKAADAIRAKLAPLREKFNQEFRSQKAA